MEKQKQQFPARTPPSSTEPEDLNVPEHEPPSMPEAADKPDRPAAQPDRRALASDTGPRAPIRSAGAPGSSTEPEDLNVPEHEPPSMPEAADKPSQKS
jgi:hypothetical protein